MPLKCTALSKEKVTDDRKVKSKEGYYSLLFPKQQLRWLQYYTVNTMEFLGDQQNGKEIELCTT